MKIGVIGGGIMGLTSALHLADVGCEVVLFEQGNLPNERSSSFDFHRLIRYPYGQQFGYTALVSDAFRAWSHLWERIGVDHYVQTGSLVIGSASNPWIDASALAMSKLNVPFYHLPPKQLKERFPAFRFTEQDKGLYTQTGGILKADAILLDLLGTIAEAGVKIQDNSRVVKVDPERGRIYTADQEFVFDQILSSVGAWHNRRFPGEVHPVKQTIFVHDELHPSMMLEDDCPLFLDLDSSGGYYFVPGSNVFPGKSGDHCQRRMGDVENEREASRKEIAELQKLMSTRVSPTFIPTSSLPKVCYYSVSQDESIHIRRNKRELIIYGGSGHSFKFGALFGNLVADEMMGHRSSVATSDIISGKVWAPDRQYVPLFPDAS